MTKDGKIFFITGASRSGTTLMSFILRNNEAIMGLKELQFFGEFCDPGRADTNLPTDELEKLAAWIFARQRAGIIKAHPDSNDREKARRLVASLPEKERSATGLFEAAVRELSSESGKQIPCEQTPRNIFYAEKLLERYPEAHIIHMLRDPRAVLASQKKRWKRRGLAAQNDALPLRQTLRVWVNYHPYTIARLWLRATREAWRLKDHPRFHIVRFEDLVSRPEPTVRDLCDRLGCPFDEAMLDVGQVNSSHQSSVGGARKGLHADAIDTWRRALTPGEISVIEDRCGDFMDRFEYERDASLPDRARASSELRYRLTYPWHALGVLLINPRRAWIQFQAVFANR